MYRIIGQAKECTLTTLSNGHKKWINISKKKHSHSEIPTRTLMILFRSFLLLGLADDSSEAVNESEEIKIGKTKFPSTKHFQPRKHEK